MKKAQDSNEKFASIKLSRKLVTWLKIEAAKAGIPMYLFVERTFAQRR